MSKHINPSDFRKPEHDIPELFVNRWSPRAMSGGAVSTAELLGLIEAARWAPSSFNNQPWRFVYALRDTEHWSKFFELLVEGNKTWAANAGALMVIVSKKTFDRNDKPSSTHTFDTGAAWENLSLAGSMAGLVVHGMQGFDYEAAAKALNVPPDHAVEAMAAVGRPAPADVLPEGLRKGEVPSGRRPLSEIAIEGGFK